MRTLLYLHGFRSSSHSRKAQQLKQAVAASGKPFQVITPDLSFDPTRALTDLATLCAARSPYELTLVGSSLGGYYAVVLAEKLGCRAVLLNLSIRPFETLSPYLGSQTNLYTQEVFTFTAQHLHALWERYRENITHPERYFLIVETGDTLLDYRTAVNYCSGARQIVAKGGSHDLDSFPEHIPAILAFAG